MLGRLRGQSLVEPAGPRLTNDGHVAADTMFEARCDEIRSILAEWEPEQQPEVNELVDRFARSLSSAPPVLEPAPLSS